jgi:hypothetical protein
MKLYLLQASNGWDRIVRPAGSPARRYRRTFVVAFTVFAVIAGVVLMCVR